MKKLYEIKHRITGDVIFSIETESMKLAVEAAVKARTDLRYSDLRYSDLSGAKIREDITVTKTPIVITGAYYTITIWDSHIQIGCKFHSMKDWFGFSDDVIYEMDKKHAIAFWRQWKESLKSSCIANGRYTEESKND